MSLVRAQKLSLELVGVLFQPREIVGPLHGIELDVELDGGGGGRSISRGWGVESGDRWGGERGRAAGWGLGLTLPAS